MDNLEQYGRLEERVNRSKYVEYQVWWRFSDDHNPDGWKPIGKPTQDLTVLIEIMAPEDYKPGNVWYAENPFEPDPYETEDPIELKRRKDAVSYKIKQRTVTLSDFRDMDISK